ncbi:MAG: type II toxin-antitoxin system HicA family toxin [Acidobacteria bacterium]|nr:type II toxin-antitoxin system HicA family toxin [Acidobacteriota bacterium]
MPSARAAELRRAAAKLGFERARKTGSHERWRHEDGRATTLPIHGGTDIGPSLLYRILEQLGIDLETFERLRQVDRILSQFCCG